VSNWADLLIKEYKEGRKQLRKLENSYDREDIYENEDRKKVSSMISDMTFTVKWLETGRMPGSIRGIERRSVYQNSVQMDMDIFPHHDDFAEVDERIDKELMKRRANTT